MGQLASLGADLMLLSTQRVHLIHILAGNNLRDADLHV